MTRWSYLCLATSYLAVNSHAFVNPSHGSTSSTSNNGLSMRPDQTGNWFQADESWDEIPPSRRRHNGEYPTPYDGMEERASGNYHPRGQSYYQRPSTSRSIPGPDYLSRMQRQTDPSWRRQEFPSYAPDDPLNMGHPQGRRQGGVPGPDYLETVQKFNPFKQPPSQQQQQQQQQQRPPKAPPRDITNKQQSAPKPQPAQQQPPRETFHKQEPVRPAANPPPPPPPQPPRDPFVASSPPRRPTEPTFRPEQWGAENVRVKGRTVPRTPPTTDDAPQDFVWHPVPDDIGADHAFMHRYNTSPLEFEFDWIQPPPPQQQQPNASVATMMTQEHKRILIEELGFRRKDVKRLKFDKVQEIIQQRIRCPPEGPKEEWCQS